MNNLKIGVIGLNGIGSYFVRHLSESVKKDIRGFDCVDPLRIDLIDHDTIEEKNLAYTIYDIEHLDLNKAQVSAELTNYNAVDKKITKIEEIKKYDFIILCVDNNTIRQLVFKSGVAFLDLRSQAKTIMAWLTRKGNPDYLPMTVDKGLSGGCQLDTDIEERNIQFGNRIVASIGIQLFKDYLNGEISEKRILLTF